MERESMTSITEPIGWACHRCTFVNTSDIALVCDMCFSTREILESSTVASDWSDFKQPVKRAKVTTSAAKSSSSSAIQQMRQMTLDSIRFQFPHRLPESEVGIPLLLQSCAEENDMSITLSTPHIWHYCQSGSYGARWSCGYRNIQMLCSGLMQIPELASSLFAKDGVIPHIYVLQSYIEKAWKAGFDKEGAEQFRYRLCGSSKYIGTTECAALLRYFRLRAVIVDFPSDPSARGVVTDSSTNTAMGDRLFSWLSRYYATDPTEEIGQQLRSSIYFQHDGHSRTILGVHWKVDSSTESTATSTMQSSPSDSPVVQNVIIFDPSSQGKQMLQNLLCNNSQWKRQLLHNSTEFRKTEYQMLYVAPGLMDDDEYERSKVLIGESELAPIRMQL